MSYSPVSTIATVAGRELKVTSKNKGITITVVIILILLAVGPFLISWLSGDDEGAGAEPSTINVATNAPHWVAGEEFDVIEATDRGAAESAVADGLADIALIETAGELELISDGTVGIATETAVQSSIEAVAQAAALEELGISPEEYAAAVGAHAPPPLTFTDISTEQINEDFSATNMAVAMTGLAVIFFLVILFAANIGGRVAEEKASRVVEIILAAVRPFDLLAGKIVAMTVYAIIWTAIFIAVGFASASFSGLLGDIDLDPSLVLLLGLSLVLSILFFGALYAAAGAMVQRTEDLNSTGTPIMLLLLIAFYIPIFGATATGSTFMTIMTWLPPFSAMVVPVQYGAGEIGLGQGLLSMVIMAVVAAGAIWLVGRIYRATILNNSSKTGWGKALRASA